MFKKILYSFFFVILLISCKEKKGQPLTYSQIVSSRQAQLDSALKTYMLKERPHAAAVIIYNPSLDQETINSLKENVVAQNNKYKAQIQNPDSSSEIYNPPTKVSLENATASYKNSREHLITLLENYPGLSIIDRTKTDQVLKEHKFQMSEWSDDNKTAEIGKVLNAQFLIFPKLKSVSIYDSGLIYFFKAEILNINTMEKFSADEFDLQENKIEFSTDQKPLSLTYVSSLKSNKNLTPENVFNFCPFVNTLSFDLESTKFKWTQALDNLYFDYENKLCTFEYVDGSQENFKLIYSSQSSKDILVDYHRDMGIDSNKYLITGDLNPSIHLTTGLIGTVTLRGKDHSLSECKIYNYGEEYILDLGSEKADGSGIHYYLKFSSN